MKGRGRDDNLKALTKKGGCLVVYNTSLPYEFESIFGLQRLVASRSISVLSESSNGFQRGYATS